MPDSLPSNYNYLLVAISILIAMLSAYTAVDLVGRIKASVNGSKRIWLGSGAIAMGIGIWATHFIGMLAFRLPINVHYDLAIVLLSILPAVLASGVALLVASLPNFNGLKIGASSFFMGGAITSMHYIGMAAIQSNVNIHYDLRLVITSAIVAIILSSIGLYSFSLLQDDQESLPLKTRLIATLSMGSAIPAMHYIGMDAACFKSMVLDVALSKSLQSPDNTSIIAIGTILCSLIILGTTILSAFFDRRLAAEIICNKSLKANQEYLENLLERTQNGVIVTEADNNVCLANQAALTLLELENKKNLQALINGENSTENSLTKAVLKRINLQKPITKKVICKDLDSKSQRPKALLLDMVPLELGSNKQPQFVYTLNDISPLKKTELQLQQSKQKFKAIAQREEIFSQLSTQIRESLDIRQILQTTTQAIRLNFQVSRAMIYEFSQDLHDCFTVEALEAGWPTAQQETYHKFLSTGILDQYRQGKTNCIENLDNVCLDQEHHYFLQRLQVQAILATPIIVNGDLWGLLIVHQCDRPRRWTMGEKSLLERLATQTGIALQQAKLYDEVEQNYQDAQKKAEELAISQEKLEQQSTVLRQNLEELKSIQMQLIQSEKLSALGELVAGIAHEINNPINFIHGNIHHAEKYTEDLLAILNLYQQEHVNKSIQLQELEDELDLDFIAKDFPKLLNSMEIGTDRIKEIILSLRNFSRLDESEFKQADLHEGLESTLLILQHRLKTNGDRPAITVQKNYAEIPMIDCFPGQLNQVFMNILTNSIDAIDEYMTGLSSQAKGTYPATITIQTLTCHHNVIIKISDNGVGMSRAVMDKIFIPFFTTKAIGKGTGLGMSISYQIITEKHRGALKCFSQLGKGSEFVMSIPVQQLKPQA